MIGVVILNYLNYIDTIECVDSILKQDSQSIRIVIVDNYSNNESIKKLVKEYQKIPTISILQTQRNEGFARGNNVGITYLLDKYNIQNIFVANNDTIFTDEKYFSELSNINLSNDVGAIGTRIIGADNINQNPVRVKTGFLNLVKALIDINLKKSNLKKNKIKKHITNDSLEGIKKLDDSFLHGSGILLTSNYLRRARGFYPKTFLYFEENILSMILKKMNLCQAYYACLSMYHKEDQSSIQSFNNDDNVKYEYSIESVKIGFSIYFSNIDRILKKINDMNYSYRVIKE